MTQSSNQTDAYREPVREMLFDAQRELKDVVIANAAGVTRQFIGLVVGGIKGLSLRAFFSMWENGGRPITDRIARLMMRLNPNYLIAWRAVSPSANPKAGACASIRDAVDFMECVEQTLADGRVCDVEFAEILRRRAFVAERFDQIVEGLRQQMKAGNTQRRK